MAEMIYPSICARPNGEVVRAWARRFSLSFENIGTFPIPCWPLAMVVGATDTELAAIGQGQEGEYGGAAMLIHSDGRLENLGAAHGTICCGLRPTMAGLLAVWVSDGGQTYSERLVSGGPVKTIPMPVPVVGTSQGFIGFDADGTPAWTDLNRAVEKHGRLLTLPTHPVNGWTGGQSNNFYGVEAVHDDGRIRKVADANIQLPPQSAAHPDGSVEACFAFETDNALDLFRHESQWMTLEAIPPPVVLPPPVVTPPTPPVVTPPDCSAAEQRAKEAEAERDELKRLNSDLQTRNGQLVTMRQQADADNARLTAEVTRLQAIEGSYQKIPTWIRRHYV